MIKRKGVAWYAVLVAAAAACSSTPPAPHAVLDGDVTQLRTAFNADSGKVRAIFLASPT